MRPFFLRFQNEAEFLKAGEKCGWWKAPVTVTATWPIYESVLVKAEDGELVYEVRVVGEKEVTTTIPTNMDGSSPEWCYHVVGLLYTKAVMVNGVITAPSVQKPGFHVNVLAEALPDSLLPYVVEPLTPECVFAGWQDWALPKEIDV